MSEDIWVHGDLGCVHERVHWNIVALCPLSCSHIKLAAICWTSPACQGLGLHGDWDVAPAPVRGASTENRQTHRQRDDRLTHKCDEV